MKFGHNLSRNQVSEWSGSYIQYKILKKSIKVASASLNQGQNADLAEFSRSLDDSLNAVNSFYNKKLADLERRVRLIKERYETPKHCVDSLDQDELEDLVGVLLELRTQFKKLQFYADVNRRGFTKITKKVDKKIPSSQFQRDYLPAKVDITQFATNTVLSRDLTEVNEWLTIVGDIVPNDDTISVRSVTSNKNNSTRNYFNLPAVISEAIDEALSDDDPEELKKTLQQFPSNQTLYLNLLQRSVSNRAKECVIEILSHLQSLDTEVEFDHRNVFHRLILAIARSSKIEQKLEVTKPTHKLLDPSQNLGRPPLIRLRSEAESNAKISNVTSQTDMLEFLLNNVNESHRSALISKDAYGRTPLHYAAETGMDQITKLIAIRMKQWNQLDATVWRDSENMSPLHMSVMNGHVSAIRVLLDEVETPLLEQQELGPALLAVAVKHNHTIIIELLIKARYDVNHQDSQGETALHVAARYGNLDCVKILIGTSGISKINLNVPEKTFGWTPIFSACANGHKSVVETLIQAGAEQDRVDLSGWTAKEHASLRGFLDIGRLLDNSEIPKGETNVKAAVPSLKPSNNTIKPVKTFGHRYLRDQSMVLISLGSVDTRTLIEPIDLDTRAISKMFPNQTDTSLSVKISATGATGDETIIDLPPQENIVTEPVTFFTKDLSKVKILFDIIPTYAGAKDKIFGRGAAFISSIKKNIGPVMVNLQGDINVPIVAATTLDVIGTVNFNFLVINPFDHPNMEISEEQTFWKSPVVIGHRGLGKNAAATKSLQLGENTIPSFIAAANLGASYVEFDVQMTKDRVPVIYHDFLVSETGIDAPVHTLTLEQFLQVGQSDTSYRSRQPSPAPRRSRPEESNGIERNGEGRQRSYSVGSEDSSRALQYISEKMKNTRTFKELGWKANTYGNVIKAPFTTLEEMFRELPEHIGFNIEMKYPMLFESEDQGMDTYAVELNIFVDGVLKTVYDMAKKRRIIFSSFHPDVCLMLAYKQPSIPVLFLTDAGHSPAGDIRAQSLQQAIRFASRWDLLGIVSAAEPFIMCPRLVRVVKESGLVCLSYGTLNNEPDNVKIQINEGIDAVIVDKVAAFRQGLTVDDIKAN